MTDVIPTETSPELEAAPTRMIERMARALVDAYPCLPHEERAADDPAMWDVCRAILEAISEPSEPMLVGARDWSDRKYGKPIGNDAAQGCWRSMIDAALAEGV